MHFPIVPLAKYLVKISVNVGAVVGGAPLLDPLDPPSGPLLDPLDPLDPPDGPPLDPLPEGCPVPLELPECAPLLEPPLEDGPELLTAPLLLLPEDPLLLPDEELPAPDASSLG